jgi:hypothetical protein
MCGNGGIVVNDWHGIRGMPDLTIRIKKKSDGSAALSCIRADGTTTWQQQNGKLGRFFPLHDLTHYAVESVLGFRNAFYGLVAAGWDLTDFASTGPRGRIPPEALCAEVVVGYFDLERATGVLGTAELLNARLDEFHADNKLPAPELRCSENQVHHIRRVRGDLFARWNAVAPGNALVLSFERNAEPVAAPDTNHRTPA